MDWSSGYPWLDTQVNQNFNAWSGSTGFLTNHDLDPQVKPVGFQLSTGYLQIQVTGIHKDMDHPQQPVNHDNTIY
jgi:hypothetical protein